MKKFTINFVNGREPIEIEGEDLKSAVEARIKSRNDLQYVDFRGVDLRGADLSFADFRGGVFKEADLGHTNLENAILIGCDFSKIYLKWANFTMADLKGAKLLGANVDYSCWPLWCGSLKVRIDKKIFCQLLYHTLRAGQSVDDPEVKALFENEELLNLANQFHRVDECNEIEKEDVVK